MKYELNVLMTSRDRSILTKKSIDSLYENSTIFNSINIYLYDNYSKLDKDRLDLIASLLEESKICYYSYNTKESTGNCFPKMMAHIDWSYYINIIYKLKLKEQSNSELKSYFLIMDNDMIVNSEWDSYFISCCDDVNSKYKNIRFMIPFPGGIPEKISKQSPILKTYNKFSKNEKIEYLLSNQGGGSGFWFMTNEMLQSIKLRIEDIYKTYQKFKMHDSTIWNKIKEDQGQLSYCAALKQPSEDTPYVIHLGKSFGSVCNNLVNKTYDENKNKLIEDEKIIEDMSIKEIIEIYKEECSKW